MMQISVKREEIEMLKKSRLAEKEQQAQIEKLQNEINELEKKAKKIRKENSQDFENILNKEQRAELEIMKAEGRARYEKRHQPRPPFQGLGTPSLLFRPLIPPPHNDNSGLWK